MGFYSTSGGTQSSSTLNMKPICVPTPPPARQPPKQYPNEKVMPKPLGCNKAVDVYQQRRVLRDKGLNATASSGELIYVAFWSGEQ